ncbi:MAG: hypothetical protein ACP5UD_07275 [Conexivisphaera sp.]
MRRPRHPFERVLSWLSGFKFFHNYVLANTSLGRAPLGVESASLAGGIRVRQDPGLDSLPGLGGDGAWACDLKLTEPPSVR